MPEPAEIPALVVADPNGRRSRFTLLPLPFCIGRGPDNHLILRDTRVSRNHARIVRRDDTYVIEDLASRHGVWVNGVRIENEQPLNGAENIEFGVPEGYRLQFVTTGGDPGRPAPKPALAEAVREGGSGLGKLRAVLEVARSLQNSFSADDVLNTVVDAALTVTGAERGFLLLFNEDRELQVRSARSSLGGQLPEDDLRVPRRVIQRALESRHDLFSMSFDPLATGENLPANTVMDLELRAVVCVPLVHVALSGAAGTQLMSASQSSAGLLYMDSRAGTVDLAGGNRELLQTLAIEASTVLENARLLEEERIKQRMEEELDVARHIQQGLLPRALPDSGWFRVAGSSVASHQVGGDYFDVVQVAPDVWSLVIADVAGKGVSSALLASFLQGVFLSASAITDIAEVFSRINGFLTDRAEHGKYATMFYSRLDRQGRLTFVNAGHCAPLLVRAGGETEKLETTSMPVGLMPGARFHVGSRELHPGDRLVLYSDGVTEAQNGQGEFFTRKRLREAIASLAADAGAPETHEAIQKAVLEFTAGAEQADDITLVVMEYRGV